MATTELNFGPEWLRALSDGKDKTTINNSSNLPNNPIPNSGNGKAKPLSKSSLSSCSMSSSNSSTSTVSSYSRQLNNSEIKYRYSKEEILSYFNRSLNSPIAPPIDLMEHGEVFVENVQNPLALIELSLDEINLLSQSINSEFALKKSNPSVNNAGAEQNTLNAENSASNGNNGTNSFKDMSQRTKILNMSASSDLLSRNAVASSERSKICTNGFISGCLDRGNNSYSTRGRGVSSAERTVTGSATRSSLRSTSNIVFTRLSSTDDTATASGTSSSKSNSVFIPKKGSGIQRSSTGENSPNNSALFMPWRSSSVSSSNSSTNNQNNGDTKEWKSASTNTNNGHVAGNEASKSWRTETITTSNGGNGSSYSNVPSSKIGVSSLPHKDRKDFFGDSLEGFDQDMPTSGRKTRNVDNLQSGNAIVNNNKSSKPFNRRFVTSNSTNEQNDLFKSNIETNNSNHGSHHHHHSTSHHRDHISHQHSYDGSMADAERDLFGGRAAASQTAQSSASNYGDLFSGSTSIRSVSAGSGSANNSSNNGKASTLVGGLNRFSREPVSNNSNTFGYPENSKFTSSNHFFAKSYDRDRCMSSGSYYQRSSQQYERSARSNIGNNQSGMNNDDLDFFQERIGGGRNVAAGGLDDEDFRRNSIPEWSLDDPSNIDVTRVGTFDASGAFHEALEDEEEDFFHNGDCKSSANPTLSIKNIAQTNDEENDKNDKKSNSKNEPIMNESDCDLLDRHLEREQVIKPERTDSKPKTIDYFDETPLSPNQQNSAIQRHKTVDETSQFVTSSAPLLVNQANMDAASIDDYNANENRKSGVENMVLVKHYNCLSMKTDGHGDHHVLNESDFNQFHSNQTDSGDGGGSEQFMQDSTFSMVSALNQQQKASISSGQVSKSVLNETLSSFKSTRPMFSSDSYLNTNQTEDLLLTSTKNHPISQERLINDSLKLSSLLNDFNFDFVANGDHTSAASVPVSAAINNTEQIFHRIPSPGTSSAIIQPNMAPHSSFMDNSHKAVNGTSQTFASPPAMLFKARNLLNFTDSSAEQQQQQQPFVGQRFSNILPHPNIAAATTTSSSSTSSSAPVPPKQLASDTVDSNREESVPHHSNLKNNWFYCDPQGQTQGPFTNQEMYDWFNEKYFSPELLVKRASDPKFTKLGDLIQACGGRCPFIVSMPSLASSSSTASVGASNSSPTPPIGHLQHHSQQQQQQHHQPQQNHHHHHQQQTNNFSLANEGSGLFPNFLQNSQHATPTVPMPTPSLAQSQLSNQQTTGSAPVMKRFLSTQGQPPPMHSTASHSFGSGANSFRMNNAIIESFGLYPNLKPDASMIMNNSDARDPRTNLPINIDETILQTTRDRLTDLVQSNHPKQSEQQLQTSESSAPSESSTIPAGTPIAQISAANSLVQDNQMRLFINHLIQQPAQAQCKEEFLALNTQQREQYLQEKFHQFNLTHNKDQLRQALNDQYHMNQCVTPSSIAGRPQTNAVEMMYPIDGDHFSTANNGSGLVRTAKKLSLDDSFISRQADNEQPPLEQSLKRGQSYEPPTTFSASQMDLENSFPRHSEHQAPDTKDDPLQLLKKYASNSTAPPPPTAAASTNPSWMANNFLPGALSVTDVEELQRREAEERYRSLQQTKQGGEKSDLIDADGESGEFIEVDRKQKHRQQNQQKLMMKKNGTKESVSETVKPAVAVLQQQASPQPVRTSPTNVINSAFIPQMPQLPKKAVWGNPATTTAAEDVDLQQSKMQTLSIAEIQRLQEEKEEEEERKRQKGIQQMNAMVQQQQKSMKWASQPWQEQNLSNVKTLAEIQAEEAEKVAAVRQQQHQQEVSEMTARRRSAAPLAAIVAKNSSSSSVWNSQETGKHWDEDDQQTINNGASINYKNAVAAGQKSSSKTVDSGMLKHMMKTNPRVIKKIEVNDSQVMKLCIENQDELIRYSVEILNKHFDSIDASAFVAQIKDLGSPSEVSEYCQSYLGNNNVSMFFSKFFITKKSHIMKLRQQQEQERIKQLQSSAKKNTWNNNCGSLNHEEDHNHQAIMQPTRVINYRSALNNSNSQQSSSSVLKTSKNDVNRPNAASGIGVSNVSNSAHIKTAVLKTVPAKTKGNEDVNPMTIQVESMEEFDKWCLDVLKLNFELNIDAETFVSFLKDIASPDEINDYVQTYLGSNKISRDFAKNFISKRSYLRNKAKQNEPYEDMCGPAPALTPIVNSANNDNNGFVTVSSSNKKKRSKNKNQQNHPNE